MTYYEELTRAMTMLAQHKKTVFVGQSVVYGGQAMHKSFSGVPMNRRIEFPVAENMQLGFCTGMSLDGFVPISVFPRFDFLLSAADQLINHLDKVMQVSGFKPKVIIRTAVGSTSPLNPGPQHTQDHSKAFRSMLKTVAVRELRKTKDIMPAYQAALDSDVSTILVEYASEYQK